MKVSLYFSPKDHIKGTLILKRISEFVQNHEKEEKLEITSEKTLSALVALKKTLLKLLITLKMQ